MTKRLIVFALALLWATAARGQTSPVPNSTFVSTWVWDCAGNISSGEGDLWGTGWHSDGTLITAWGDDKGFQGSSGNSFGFASLAGTPVRLNDGSVVGTDISDTADLGTEWCLTDAGVIDPTGCTNQGGKPEGNFMVDNDVFYFVLDTQGTGDDYAFAYSSDKMASFTMCATTFPELVSGGNPEPQPGVPIGGFISFGQNNADARDGYFYVATSGHIQGRTVDFSEDVGLMRILAPTPGNESDICDAPDGNKVYAKWEFLSGPDVDVDGILDSGATPTWSSDRDDQIAIFSDPATVARPDIFYNDVIGRYFMVMNHNVSGDLKPDQAGMGVFDAPDPWGPWTTVDYDNTWCDTELSIPADTFPLTWHQQRKWLSVDGLTSWGTWSTAGVHDVFNALPATMTLAAGCGNAVIDAGEACDGANLGSPAQTCSDEGFPSGTIACDADCGVAALANGYSGFDVRGCDDIASSDTPSPAYDPLLTWYSSVAEMADEDNHSYVVIGEGKNGCNHGMCDDAEAEIIANESGRDFLLTLGDMTAFPADCSDLSTTADGIGDLMRLEPHWAANGDQEPDGCYLTFYNLPSPNYWFDLGQWRYITNEYKNPTLADVFTNALTGVTATYQQVLDGTGNGSPHPGNAVVFDHEQFVMWADAPSPKCDTNCSGGVCRCQNTMRAAFEANNVKIVFQADNKGYGRILDNGVHYVWTSYVHPQSSARTYCANNDGWGHGTNDANCAPSCNDSSSYPNPSACQPFYTKVDVVGAQATITTVEVNASGNILDTVTFGGTPSTIEFTTGTITLTPSYNTIGAEVQFTGDSDKDATITLSYKLTADTEFITVHPLARTPDQTDTPSSSLDPRFAGRVFWLAEGTSYDVRIFIADPDGVVGATLYNETVSTKTTPVPAIASTVYLDPVSGNDSTGDGTSGNPWKTIESVGKAGVNAVTCGTRVILKDGLYQETVENVFDLACTNLAWISLQADTGATPIIDGSDPEYTNPADGDDDWTQNGTFAKIYETTINSPELGTNGVDRVSWGPSELWLAHYIVTEGKTLALLDADQSGLGHGWFYDANVGPGEPDGTGQTGTLYVWLPGSTDAVPIDPDTVAIYANRLKTLLDFQNSSFVEVDGLTFRWGWSGMKFTNTTDGYVHNNQAHGLVYPLEFRNLGGNVLVEDNTVFDKGVTTGVLPPLGPGSSQYEWFKQNYTTEHQCYKVVDAGDGYVFRDNVCHDVFNGGIWEDDAGAELKNLEIYDNRFTDILDDGFEPEGHLYNAAIWNNRIEGALAGISGAPINIGPIFIMYNTVIDHSLRSIKFNHGNCSNCGNAPWFIYHNTLANSLLQASDPATDGDGLRVPGFSEGMNTIWRNNIIVGRWRAIDDTVSPAANKIRDMNYNGLWRVETGAPDILKWESTTYATFALYQAGTPNETNGLFADPLFIDFLDTTAARSKNMNLRPASTMIDAGIVIQGINDLGTFQFLGTAPDLGAAEAGTSVTATGVKFTGVTIK